MCKVLNSIYDCTTFLSIIQRMKANLFFTYLSAFEPSTSIYRVLRLSYSMLFHHLKQQSDALTYIYRGYIEGIKRVFRGYTEDI